MNKDALITESPDGSVHLKNALIIYNADLIVHSQFKGEGLRHTIVGVHFWRGLPRWWEIKKWWALIRAIKKYGTKEAQ